MVVFEGIIVNFEDPSFVFPPAVLHALHLMPHPYVSFDPTAQINGETLQALESALLSPLTAGRLLHQHGLPAQPQRGAWYPLQAWLDLLAEIDKAYGSPTLFAVGLESSKCSVWPVPLPTLREALESLEAACRLNVQGSAIGYYQVHELSAGEVRVVCLTPTPPAFECGLLTGLARRFQPAGSPPVRVEMEMPPSPVHPLLKWFRVRW